MERHDLEKYDWREHRCTWRDCAAESVLLAALIGFVLLAGGVF